MPRGGPSDGGRALLGASGCFPPRTTEFDGADRGVVRGPRGGAGGLSQHARRVSGRSPRLSRLPRSQRMSARGRRPRGAHALSGRSQAARPQRTEPGAPAVLASWAVQASAHDGGDRARSHRAPRGAAAATAAAANAVARGGRRAHRSPRRHPAGWPARSRAARAPVCVRPARVRGARPRGGRRQSRGGLRHGHGQGQSPAPGPDGRAGASLGAELSAKGPPAAAEARRPRHALLESVGARAVPPGAVGIAEAVRAALRRPCGRVAPHAAPLLREPSARARRRPAICAGHARPCRYLDDPDLHAPDLERRPGHVHEVPSARPEGEMTMARAGAMYPQVEPGAVALMTGRIARGSARATVAEALDVCRRHRVSGIALAPGRIVRERDLTQMMEWGQGSLLARDIAWTGLPALEPSRPEVDARRVLMSGTPLLLLREGRHVIGVVDRAAAGIGPPRASRSGLVDIRLESEARRWLLSTAGRLGDAMHAPVFAVGGFVRDLALGRAAPDIDLVVDGDGIAFARRLAGEVGGRLVIHAGFGTASIDGAASPDGTALGRIDVAAARRERYGEPGALPSVSPAGIWDDLLRRDFSVNAMALALAPSDFGMLLD